MAAELNSHFSNIKQFLSDHHGQQADQECDQALLACSKAHGDFETKKAELIGKFGADQLFDDLEFIIDAYLGA